MRVTDQSKVIAFNGKQSDSSFPHWIQLDRFEVLMPVIQQGISVAVDNILLATDFSQASENAAAYAKALARRFTSTVEIAHVFNSSQVLSEEEALPGPPLFDRRQNSSNCLENLRGEFEAAGIRVRTVSREGHNATKTLLEIANEDNIDLIVAGTLSKRGIERLILGSTAEGLFRNAPCPVLTVGPKVELPTGPLAFRAVIFATDFSAEAARAAAFALSFAEDSNAQLYFLHVVESYPGSQAEAPVVDAMFEATLRKMIPESCYDWCSPECVLEHGDASKGVLALAARVHADLIVLGPRKASFVLDYVERGLTPRLLAEAPCPVLSFRR